MDVQTDKNWSKRVLNAFRNKCCELYELKEGETRARDLIALVKRGPAREILVSEAEEHTYLILPRTIMIWPILDIALQLSEMEEAGRFPNVKCGRGSKVSVSTVAFNGEEMLFNPCRNRSLCYTAPIDEMFYIIDNNFEVSPLR